MSFKSYIQAYIIHEYKVCRIVKSNIFKKHFLQYRLYQICFTVSIKRT